MKKMGMVIKAQGREGERGRLWHVVDLRNAVSNRRVGSSLVQTGGEGGDDVF